MDDLLIQQKISYFLNDRAMSDAVRKVLTDTFLKKSAGGDVHLLAGARIALDLLEDGYKELEKIKHKEVDVPQIKKQQGY